MNTNRENALLLINLLLVEYLEAVLGVTNRKMHAHDCVS